MKKGSIHKTSGLPSDALLLEQRKVLVQQLIQLLKGGNAHIRFEEAAEGIPLEYCDRKPGTLPYTLWQLVEHIRITQKDILEFSRNPQYQSPPWPEGYWPAEPGPSDAVQWKNSLQEIKKDRETFISLLADSQNDLFEPFPHGDGQNLVREAMLIADHTSYHTGQIIVIRRMLGIYD